MNEMINIGKYCGQYTFDNPKILAARGFNNTNFTVEIKSISDNYFSGTIEDNQATGGMEGIGKVNGKFSTNMIKFTKEMPRMTILMNKNGQRKTFHKKHRKIYYTGNLSANGSTISGMWRFKLGFVWFGILPNLMWPTKGTWEMTIYNQI